MAARFRKVDASLDRRILIGMIVSTKFLKAVVSIFRTDYMTTPMAVWVSKVCFDYLQNYGEAPGKHIQDLFNVQVRNNTIDDATVDSIEHLLASLSDEYEHADNFNAEYLLDQTEQLFRSRALKFLGEDVQAAVESGDLDAADERIFLYRNLRRPRQETLEAFNPEKNMDAYQAAFESREEPLFLIPGDLGELMNPHFIREGFIGILGKAKVGKTWQLQNFAMWAIRGHCNVAFFQLGDLSQNDYMIRQGIYLSKKSNLERYCKPLLTPIPDCLNNQTLRCKNRRGLPKDVVAEVLEGKLVLVEDWEKLVGRHEPCTVCLRKHRPDFHGTVWFEERPRVEPLSWREAYRITDKWAKRYRAKSRFRLSTHPNSTVSVREVEAILNRWEDDGWVPDVIILDYADIMAPEDRRKNELEQENDRWKALRRLSQERKCCVITATQTNRGGFDTDSLAEKDMGGYIRKLQHVTGFFTLNQTRQDKERGLLRVSALSLREGKFSIDQQVCVLQSLETGQPYIASYEKKFLKKEKKNLKNGMK